MFWVFVDETTGKLDWSYELSLWTMSSQVVYEACTTEVGIQKLKKNPNQKKFLNNKDLYWTHNNSCFFPFECSWKICNSWRALGFRFFLLFWYLLFIGSRNSLKNAIKHKGKGVVPSVGQIEKKWIYSKKLNQTFIVLSYTDFLINLEFSSTALIQKY